MPLDLFTATLLHLPADIAAANTPHREAGGIAAPAHVQRRADDEGEAGIGLAQGHQSLDHVPALQRNTSRTSHTCTHTLTHTYTHVHTSMPVTVINDTPMVMLCSDACLVISNHSVLVSASSVPAMKVKEEASSQQPQ